MLSTVVGFSLTSGVGSSAATKSDVPEDAIPIDGPTVITEPGYYVLTQNLVVDDPDAGTLILVEPGVSGVTIDGQGFCLTGPGETEDFGPTAIRAGEYLEANTEDVTIKNVSITKFEDGIALGDFFGGSIRNVEITKCVNAFLFRNANQLTVSDCYVAKNDIAIFEDETIDETTFTGNEFVKNGFIDNNFLFCQNVRFEKNRFERNGGELSFGSSSGTAIVNNVFYRNAAGVNITESVEETSDNPNVIQRNRFVENDDYGVFVGEISRNVVVEKNHVLRNGGIGIRVESGANNCLISKNRVEENGDDGILLSNADENRIVKNQIRNNSGDGIELRSSDDNVIRKNIITGNGGVPIRIDDESTGNVIEKNKTDENGGGQNSNGDDDDGSDDICRVDSH